MLSDDQLRLAWHDVMCPRGSVCPRRGAHAREADAAALRRFVDALGAGSDEVSDADLELAERRLHLMMHVAQAEEARSIEVGVRRLALLLWAKRSGRLPGDVHMSNRVSADEYAAIVLGYRDDVPVACMDMGG
jgi:hypothetical protein